MTKGVAPSAWSAARRYAVLSIAAAVLTIGLKAAAYLVTGSVGLFSDATESVVNRVAAVAALWALIYASRPPDEEHAFGHNKAEYFSSGMESALIITAAVWIGVTAWERLMDPQPLENVGLGLSIALVAAALNGGVALVIPARGAEVTLHHAAGRRAPPAHGCRDLFRRGARRCYGAAHRMAGAGPPDRARRRREHRVDGRPAPARNSQRAARPGPSPEDQEAISKVLSRYEERGVRFHALRTRASGQRRFISMHVLVPGRWTVQQGHDFSEKIERDIFEALQGSTLFIHIEPSEDPASFADQSLDRGLAGERS